MTLVTDMNHRERKRYIALIELHIKQCEDLVEAIRLEDDMKAMFALVQVALAERFVNELIEVFRDAENLEVPDHL